MPLVSWDLLSPQGLMTFIVFVLVQLANCLFFDCRTTLVTTGIMPCHDRHMRANNIEGILPVPSVQWDHPTH
jgi:hypothetical protein